MKRKGSSWCARAARISVVICWRKETGSTDLDLVAPREKVPCQLQHAACAEAHDDAAFGMLFDGLA